MKAPEETRCARCRVAVPAAAAAPVLVDEDGPMVAAVRLELERCRADRSVAGTVALRLARALDDPQLGAAQVSSISAQLLRTLEPIQKAAPPQADRLDDLAEKAKARREAAAAS